MLSIAPICHDSGNAFKLKSLFSGVEFLELNMRKKCPSNYERSNVRFFLLLNLDILLRITGLTLFAVCRIYVYSCRQQRDVDRHQVFGRIIYVYAVQSGGTGRNLVAPLLVYRLA
jgi:hypothetical protein